MRSFARATRAPGNGMATRPVPWGDRTIAGITQVELARRSGTSRPNVVRLERGDHAPTLDVLARVAFALDVTLLDVLGPLCAYFDKTWKRSKPSIDEMMSRADMRHGPRGADDE